MAARLSLFIKFGPQLTMGTHPHTCIPSQEQCQMNLYFLGPQAQYTHNLKKIKDHAPFLRVRSVPIFM